MRSSQVYPNSGTSSQEELDTIHDPAYVEWVTKIRDFLTNHPNLTVAEFDDFCSKHPEAYLLFFANPNAYPFATEQFINEYKALENQRIAGVEKKNVSTNLTCSFYQPAPHTVISDPTPESSAQLSMTTD